MKHLMIYHEAAVVRATRDLDRKAGLQLSKDCSIESANAIMPGPENLAAGKNGKHRLRGDCGHHTWYVAGVRRIDKALHDGRG
jgi:hypothetical protein